MIGIRHRKLWLPLLLFILLVAFCYQTNGSIGFKRTYPTERLVDPTRFPPKYGLASSIWDSSAVDTTLSEDLDTLTTPQDSVQIEIPSEISSKLIDKETKDSSDSLVALEEFTKKEDISTELGEVSSGGATVTESTGAAGTTSDLIGSDFDYQENETPDQEQKEDILPIRPTLIYQVGIPLEVEARLDTSTNYVVLNQRLSGSDMPGAGALSRDVYLERSIRSADRESWRQSVVNKMPKQIKSTEGGINISLPILPKRMGQWLDGRNIGLTVSGHIDVSGEMRVQKKEELQQDNPNPTDYQFKVDQTQSFVIKGKVGEKVSVDINQDSDRLFDVENSLRIKYTGNDDEILKSLEAGNVSLSLRGASLISSSSKHEGLFGFKAETQLGALKLTTIASLDKGEKNEIKADAGAQSSGKKTIPPHDYLDNRYFFLDEYYRENYKHRNNSLNPIAVPPDSQIVRIEVYKSVGIGSMDEAIFPGWALYDPDDPDFDPDNPASDQDHQDASFRRLSLGSDYEFFPLTGYIRLMTSVMKDDILAVAYSSRIQTIGELEPSNTETNIFKLLKAQNPQPTDLTWDLMWRNVYSLQAMNIAREGFEGRITYPSGEDNRDNDSGPDPAAAGEIRPYVQIFGLDHFGLEGQNAPDGYIDEAFIRFDRGELIFPDLKPFDPEGWYKAGVLQLTQLALDSIQLERHKSIYTLTKRDLTRSISSFKIIVEYKSISNTFDLRWGVLKGSVEVTMNGQRLTEGTDYTVDYISNELTILRAQALAANADIEIKYETAQMFKLDTKTLLGLRADYELWDNAHIGATMMHLNQKTLDRRVRVGGEPIRNSIWGIDASLQFKPYFLTRAMDWLPLIETDEQSTFSISAEIAQVFPAANNLNSPSTGDYNGVAYIDDFESIKRITPLGINRRQWTAASFPEDESPGESGWAKMRGRTSWYNPWEQINITDIWPDKEVQAQASKIPVLKVEFQPWWTEWGASRPDTAGVTNPERYWGGVMRYLGSGYADQSESKFIEIWLNRGTAGNGVMYIDLGRISEDIIPNNFLNTEDRPMLNRTIGNGILTKDEDTGIDTLDADDPLDMIDVNGDGRLLPSYDDWYYDRGHKNDYSHINGTEGNIEDEGGRYPDSEDLNNDTNIDHANDFYRYRIDLSERDANKYIVGGLDNTKGWRLYRIPLTDTLVVGRPSMTSLEYARVWFTGFNRPVWLMIGQIDIVGNEWQEVELRDDRGEMMDPVSVSVVNTDDNPDYEPPPGVSGEVDPITNLRSKEQSLVLKVNRLLRGQTGEVIKLLSNQQKMDLMEYRRLKMFVYMKDRYGRDRDLELSFRFGHDPDLKYYEYSKRLQSGWEDNEVIIDFDRLTSLNFLRQKDSLRNYDILPDGAMIRVVGMPSIGEIRFFSLGIKNHGRDIYEQDGVEVWVDELRVSDIHNDPGWAAKGSMDLKIARDILTINANVNQTQADFHSISKRVGQNKDYLTGRVNIGLRLDALFNPQWNVRLPLSFNFNQKVEIPKYQTNSDVLLTSLTDESIDIWSMFLNNLKSNDRYSDDPEFQKPIDSQISTDKRYSYAFSASKSKLSNNPFTRYTIERIKLSNLSYSKNYRKSSSYMYDIERDVKGNLSYDLSFENPLEIGWLSWAENLWLLNKVYESKLRPLPSSFRTNVSATESMGKTRRWNRPDEENPYSLSADRSYNIDFRPVTSLSLGFGQTVRADRIRADSTRYFIALNLSDINMPTYYNDSLSQFRDEDGLLDSTKWLDALEEDIERIQDKLFWKVFGTSFIDNSFSQNLSTNFNPSFVSWLSMNASYNPRYTWTWSNRNYGPGNRQVSVDSRFSTNLTLKLPQIMRSWGDASAKTGKIPDLNDDGGYSPMWDDNDPSKKQPRSGGSKSKFGDNRGMSPAMIEEMESFSKLPEPGTELQPDGDKEGLPEDESLTDTSKTEEKKPTRPPQNPLILLRGFLNRLSDISWDYSLNNRVQNPAIGFGHAGWKYRLGLTRDPDLEKVEGFDYADNFTRSDGHRFRSGLNITQNLSVRSFDYDYSWSRTVGQTESGSYSKTVWQSFASDGVTIKSIPAVNWSIQWSGWEKLPLLEKLASSVSLDNSFSGSQRENWNRYDADSAKVTQSVEYEKNFSPLLGISFTWKGNVSTDINYNMSQSVSDQRIGKRKTKSGTQEIRLRGSYNSRKGFRIPIPVWPFKNRRFKNNTTFSMTYSYRKNRTESSTEGAKFDPDNPDREDSGWSINPSIDYSFSQTVKGNFQYEYAVQRSLLTGKTSSQNFTFRFSISVRG
ncbi:MAG: cell surface protein SprA [Candidatus Hatepunaea meridiana]|nr:cell surface protein SprA [Candidatus Hatepunaea meridiana]